MIVSFHVATGAVAGSLVRSRGRALAIGALLHALGDRIPHRDFPSQWFELGSGMTLLGVLAATRGSASPEVVAAVGASAPDLEHILSLPKVGGRKLFPSHRLEGWHREGGIPASVQLGLACALVGLLALRGPRGPAPNR